jgi:coenzyme F420-0:L-glutamate ligase/coenzyme F420-1:gamma-L-glutamate ligase
MDIAIAPQLLLTALPGIPIVKEGDDLVAIIQKGLEGAGIELKSGDVIVVTSKLVSRAEGRLVDLREVEPSARAVEVAGITGKDPRIVELILRESESISRIKKDVLVVRHRLGMTVANAGIDRSNVDPTSTDDTKDTKGTKDTKVLLLPVDPDESAERIRRGLEGAMGEGAARAAIGVVITDSFGRPFRLGTVGVAVGVAGMPALWDQRGRTDLFGRRLEMTITALGDQIAAAADLLAGQAGEARPVVLVRGLSFPPADGRARDIVRPRELDLYS